jgi:glycosyltransferase involved in cell wall biosynthesis
MASGNGAYIAHRLLDAHLPEYQIVPYHPRWTYFPLVLPIVASTSGANLIHTTPDYSLFFHRKSAPMVITFQNYVLDRWMRDYSAWLQKLHYATDLRLWTKQALKKCSAVTAVSESTAQIVKQDMGLTRPIRVIYNGVDTNHFVPGFENKINNKEFRVFFSGNLTIRKGAHWLSHIAKKLKNKVTIFYTQGLRTRKIYKNISPNFQAIP